MRAVRAAHAGCGRRSDLAIVLVAVAIAGGLLVAGAAPASARPVWSVVPMAHPAGSLRSTLSGVACPHPNSCFAVGEYLSGSFKERSLIEHWNGQSWRVVTTNPDTSYTADLYGVACPSMQSCFVVGRHSTVASPVRTAFVEHWNGSHWAVMSVPNPSDADGLAELQSVACPLPKSCFAVGSYQTSRGTRSLVEHWNGHDWGIMSHPEGAIVNAVTALTAVSCPDLRFCFAVGTYSTGATKPLVERWNGKHWRVVRNPVPSGAGVASLSGISCVFISNCFAVGMRTIGSGTRSLVEHWNGRDWVIMATPNPAATSVEMAGVMCPSTISCFAVGNSRTSSPVTLVEHWNGKTWQIMTSPDPAGATSAALSAVACGRARSCNAVGDRSATMISSFAEHYA